MRLIDRADGSVLVSLDSGVGELLADSVEDVQGFVVGELLLAALSRQTELQDAHAALSEVWTQRGALTAGLEPVGEETPVLSGSVSDQHGQPVGGLVLTAQGAEQEALTWAFTRPDGTFQIYLPPEHRAHIELLLAGRGGLYLAGYELDELPQGADRLEPFQVQVLSGSVTLESGEPLVGGRVESWSSWAPIESDGSFRLPVERLDEVLDLEIFAHSGEPLGGYWRVEPSGEGSVGQRMVPPPTPGWPSTDGPLLAGPDEVRPLFSSPS